MPESLSPSLIRMRIDRGKPSSSHLIGRRTPFGARVSRRWVGLTVLLVGVWGIALTAQPGVRDGHGLVYHRPTEKVVMFGGWDGIRRLDETWVWDGSSWAQLFPLTTPAARVSAALCPASANGDLLLFGGLDSRGNGLADTWLWNGATWVPLSPANRPSARWGHSMAYDSHRNRVVLFGGYDTGAKRNLDDTWEWIGGDWQRVTTTTAPSARRGHKIAFDASASRAVLFGGWDGGSDNGETWEWNGATWTKSTGAGSTPRRYHGMEYDPRRGCLVLFGGERLGTTFGDVWERRSSSWKRVTPLTVRPSARRGFAMAYSPITRSVLVHGGWNSTGLQGDTLRWDGSVWEPVRRRLHVPGTFATVQSAIDAAASDDVVLVSPGVYTERIDFKGKRVTVRSAGGATLTTLDGQGVDSVVKMNGPYAVLEGFTITNGWSSQGGGIRDSANRALIRWNIVTGNQATSDGCGAGIFAGNDATIIENEITKNYVRSGGYGGGIYGRVVAVSNYIRGNFAREGGGVYGGGTLTNNIVAQNQAGNRGGGVHGTFSVTHGTFVGNHAGRGSEYFFGGSVTNSIVWNESPIVTPSPSQISFCNIKGGWAGVGNINADPLFVDASAGNFHLRQDSPCVNSGTVSISLPAWDIDGDPRVAAGAPDIGADEFSARLFSAGNPTSGGHVEILVAGLPGQSVLWGFAGATLPTPVQLPRLGVLYLDPTSLAVLPLGRIPSSGWIRFVIPLSTTFPKIKIPMQAVIGTTLSNLDAVEVR